MPASGNPPDRDAMEHAQLVMNAIARLESLLRPMLESRSPGECRVLSGEMIAWLATTPDATLRLLLFDRPCPADFFVKWASAEQMKAWKIIAAEPHGAAEVRPSDFFRAFCAQNKA